MACINVVEPMNVRTKNSVFRVEPIIDGDDVSYKAIKIETIRPVCVVKIGEGFIGKSVHIELGKRMVLGRLYTSLVVAVEYVEPHH